jgi:hypothetical protein
MGSFGGPFSPLPAAPAAPAATAEPAPAAPTYNLGGSVTGLIGAGLVLQKQRR